MTDLELYKFINNKDDEVFLEANWQGDELLVWIYHWLIEDFAKMIKSYLSDDTIKCNLTQSCEFVIDIVPICEHYGIDPNNILTKTL